MMAMLFAQRVILEKADFVATKGDSKYIPNTLKPKVAKILIEECNLPELVPVEFGGTMRE